MGGQGRDVRPSKAGPLQREAKRTMRSIYLQIPEGLAFSALRLVRKGEGVVAFDLVQEDLIAEVQVENALGGGLSHRPGTA